MLEGGKQSTKIKPASPWQTMTCYGPETLAPTCTRFGCKGMGFMPTRDLCILPQELPFQQRAFDQTTNIPQMFCGGPEGYALHTQIESSLRPEHTRDPGSCNTYELRDWGSLQYLPCGWQQPDFRPLQEQIHTRNDVKDLGRSRELRYGHTPCQYYASDGSLSYTDYPGRYWEPCAPLPYMTKTVLV